MTKVTYVKTARKPNPVVTQEMIDRAKSGEDPEAASYYWWQFAFCSKSYSKKPPKRSQLTQSEYYSQAWDMEDEIGELEAESMEDLESTVEDLVSRIQELGGEQTDKLYNMPEGLQEGDTGQLLQSRADACEAIASELECLDFELDEGEKADASLDAKEAGDVFDEGEWLSEKIREKIEEIQQVSYEWDG